MSPVAEQKRIADMSDYQCVDCWAVLFWKIADDGESIWANCSCEDGERTYVLAKKDIPHLEAVTCL